MCRPSAILQDGVLARRRGDPKRATHLMAAVKTVLRWRHRPGNAVTALPVWRRRCPPAANALA